MEPSPGASAAGAYVRASAHQRPPPRAPKLKAETPTYPAPVVYILYREFLHKNPKLTSLSPENPRYQAYMERRLRELYPNRGYSGMMRDAVTEMRGNEAAWQAYETELRTYEASTQNLVPCEPEIQSVGSQIFTTSCSGTGGSGSTDPLVDPSWSGNQEFAVPADSVLPTIPMEIDTLQLAGPEVDRIYYYESLATGRYRAAPEIESVGGGGTIDDLIRAAGEGRMARDGGVEIQVTVGDIADISVALAMAPWKAFRVVQAAHRAVQKSEEYYPSLVYDDTKRDAHRHIFLSMMLRRYVGTFIAETITDYRERRSSGPAHVMDLHNNSIGRVHRYHRFRNHWFWDRWDWQEWGRRVRDYVNEPTHAAYIPEWAPQPQPTTEQAWQREASVSDLHYIYFIN